MFLARCINAAYSDGIILLGEYYMVSPTTLQKATIWQTRVHVYQIPDCELIAENFRQQGLSREENNGFIWSKKAEAEGIFESKKPVYTTVLNRFELLIEQSQLEAACHRAKERFAYTSGSYRK
jgi:hypothetical protein